MRRARSTSPSAAVKTTTSRRYLYKSIDYGGTFTSIVDNIPAGSVNVVREDPTDPNTLFVGTDFGVFVSVDGGRHWQVLGGNLPSVQVSDLQYQARDRVIVISTYGRGMWAMDATKIRPRSDSSKIKQERGEERKQTLLPSLPFSALGTMMQREGEHR